MRQQVVRLDCQRQFLSATTACHTSSEEGGKLLLLLWSTCLCCRCCCYYCPAATRLSVADRCLAVAGHWLAVVRGVRVCLLGVPCLLRYLRTTTNNIAGRKKHGGTRNGPDLVASSPFACLLLMLLLSTTAAALVLRPLSYNRLFQRLSQYSSSKSPVIWGCVVYSVRAKGS